jgi:peptidoglycan/xylan/chitin deacetylase (PgdA/CDA1 family)
LPASAPILIAASLTAGAVAIGGTLTWAALSSGSQLFGATCIAGVDSNEAALTYDDGPNDAATPELLDLLAANNVRATFFMIGRFVREQPALARRVLAAGHLIGNHTYTHPWLHTRSEAVIREELRGCNEALEDALGVGVRYFRPPHGARRPVVLRIARELGLETVQWNVMGKDWLPIGVDGILGNIERGMAVCRKAGRGANILLHDGSDRAMSTDRTDTLAVTKTMLRRFDYRGMRAVTVDVWG